MPSFKHKTNKKITLDEKSIVTLDSKHKEIESEFYDVKVKTLPELRALKRYYKQKAQETNDKIMKIEINEKLKEINKQIHDENKKQKDYYLQNNSLIFDYFEAKKDIATGSTSENKSILNDFFKIKDHETTIKQQSANNNVKKYLINLDDDFIDVNAYTCNVEKCVKCKEGELIPVDSDGIMICNKCFSNFPYLIENEKTSYKEPPKEACFYAYKRINHFREILAQFQAKETTQIPEKIFEDIKNQIKKERISVEQLTNKKAKDILKKLGYNKFYEHIPFIKHKLGIKPPVMTQQLEEVLCNLFMDIQGPYAKYCPDDRVNFLNYYYTIYKLCELLDQKQFLPYFPMLKDREKRIEQDNIWKKICDELDWEFIPTI
jgi:hypothetical protein